MIYYYKYHASYDNLYVAAGHLALDRLVEQVISVQLHVFATILDCHCARNPIFDELMRPAAAVVVA